MTRKGAKPCYYLVLDECAVEVQGWQSSLIRTAGATKPVWFLGGQQTETGSLVLQPLTLALQDQVQQSLWLLLLATAPLQEKEQDDQSLEYNPHHALDQQRPGSRRSGTCGPEVLLLGLRVEPKLWP